MNNPIRLSASSTRTSAGAPRLWALAGLILVIVVTGLPSLAAPPRVGASGTLPEDARLQPPKDLDGYFPFVPPKTPAEWAARAERVRRQLQVTLGLWPRPTLTPLNPVIHGKIERPDYTVEKVFFESAPGFYVTGNLYRPKGQTGPRPGMLCPHGHWANGRFLDTSLEETRREIVNGAERFEEGGRSVLQARCMQLARMGCVVFHYDMIGYADSLQISHALAHGFAKQRPEMNTAENWGLFSPRAEAHYQSVMGLQTWNSMRALDFLLGLPEVDAQRIGVTGASGGGTQTFILCALDPRPALAFPAVMVSTAMQGGCTCENACGLRIDTGNVELAALFAPKPLGMTSADDWTKEMATKGFPELKQLYQLLGAADNVQLKRGEHFGHNYNYVSRAAMYQWVNRHFKLGLPEPIVEPDYPRLSTREMSVWDDQHPKPPAGPEFERRLLRWWTDDAASQLAAARTSLAEFRKVYGGAMDVVIGRHLAEVGEVKWEAVRENDRGSCTEALGWLRPVRRPEVLPAVRLQPKSWQGRTVIWIDGAGKAGLYAADGSALRPEVQQLLSAGAQVLGVDLLFQGEFLADGQPVKTTRRVKNPREAAAYTFGYNPTLFAQRAHDVLTAVKYAQSQDHGNQRVDLVGLGEAGPWVAAARALAGEAVVRAAIDTGGFRFGSVSEIHAAGFLPGAAKYGDLPGMLALGAPGALWLAGEGPTPPELLKTAYSLAGADSRLTCATPASGQAAAAAVRWLLATSL